MDVHEHVLGHVLGQVLLDDEAAHVAVDAVEEKLIEVPERVVIASDEAAQEGGIPLLGGGGLSFRRASYVQIDGGSAFSASRDREFHDRARISA
jgi:hypothetical protein